MSTASTASSIPAGQKLNYIGASETIITVSFTPNPNIDSYELCYREYAQDWSYGGVVQISSSEKNGNKITRSVDDLNPGATYSLRLVAKDSDGNKGKPGPELIVDTEAVSCTPQSKMCTIS